MESFAALFEESLARQEMRAGEVITAESLRQIYGVNVVVTRVPLEGGGERRVCIPTGVL